MPSSNPNLLAIETATAACSVALLSAGKVSTLSEVGTSIHSMRLLDMVQTLLHEASLSPQDLDAVAVAHGPGSFTGLRIGIGAAQGIAYGANCPMVGVSSLAALAHASPRSDLIVSAIDARMGEVYWAAYRKADESDYWSLDTFDNISSVTLSTPSELREQVTQLSEEREVPACLIGNAWTEYADSLGADFLTHHRHCETLLFPKANHLLPFATAKLNAGDTVSPGDFVAEYVRNNVAKKSTKKQSIKRI